MDNETPPLEKSLFRRMTGRVDERSEAGDLKGVE